MIGYNGNEPLRHLITLFRRHSIAFICLCDFVLSFLFFQLLAHWTRRLHFWSDSYAQWLKRRLTRKSFLGAWSPKIHFTGISGQKRTSNSQPVLDLANLQRESLSIRTLVSKRTSNAKIVELGFGYSSDFIHIRKTIRIVLFVMTIAATWIAKTHVIYLQFGHPNLIETSRLWLGTHQ